MAQSLAMRTLLVSAAFTLALAGSAAAQTPPSGPPELIPAPGGEVVIPAPGFRRAYDDYHYAPARRAGEVLYVSGAVVFRRPGEGNDVEAFRAQVRRGFRQLETTLKAAGATFADVAMVNTFHVWEGADFAGTKAEQFEAFKAVKAEFMPPPHPAWTAVGTTGLLGEGGIVEVQLIAHMPGR